MNENVIPQVDVKPQEKKYVSEKTYDAKVQAEREFTDFKYVFKLLANADSSEVIFPLIQKLQKSPASFYALEVDNSQLKSPAESSGSSVLIRSTAELLNKQWYLEAQQLFSELVRDRIITLPANWSKIKELVGKSKESNKHFTPEVSRKLQELETFFDKIPLIKLDQHFGEVLPPGTTAQSTLSPDQPKTLRALVRSVALAEFQMGIGFEVPDRPVEPKVAGLTPEVFGELFDAEQDEEDEGTDSKNLFQRINSALTALFARGDTYEGKADQPSEFSQTEVNFNMGWQGNKDTPLSTLAAMFKRFFQKNEEYDDRLVTGIVDQKSFFDDVKDDDWRYALKRQELLALVKKQGFEAFKLNDPKVNLIIAGSQKAQQREAAIKQNWANQPRGVEVATCAFKSTESQVSFQVAYKGVNDQGKDCYIFDWGDGNVVRQPVVDGPSIKIMGNSLLGKPMERFYVPGSHLILTEEKFPFSVIVGANELVTLVLDNQTHTIYVKTKKVEPEDIELVFSREVDEHKSEHARLKQEILGLKNPNNPQAYLDAQRALSSRTEGSALHLFKTTRTKAEFVVVAEGVLDFFEQSENALLLEKNSAFQRLIESLPGFLTAYKSDVENKYPDQVARRLSKGQGEDSISGELRPPFNYREFFIQLPN